MKSRRPLTESELALWRRSVADVDPLGDKRPTDPAPSATKPAPNGTADGEPKPRMTGKASREPAVKGAPRALDSQGPVDIDRRSWEKLKRGRIEIDRKLDLHGQTQAEAHRALNRFLAMASATGLRCVLVVTGKGRIKGRGVLREMVPRWLGEADNRDKVLTYCPAQRRHGGDGALYVLLRRRRDRHKG